MDDICVVHIGWIKGGTAIQSPFASPMGCRGLFCCFKWIQPLPGGLLQREKLYLLMFSRNLFVLDFVRRFFVSCAQISEAYAVRTLMKFGCDWRKISHKSKCKKDSERTFLLQYAKNRIHPCLRRTKIRNVSQYMEP